MILTPFHSMNYLSIVGARKFRSRKSFHVIEIIVGAEVLRNQWWRWIPRPQLPTVILYKDFLIKGFFYPNVILTSTNKLIFAWPSSQSGEYIIIEYFMLYMKEKCCLYETVFRRHQSAKIDVVSSQKLLRVF